MPSDIDYSQFYLDVNPWDASRTKSRLSTIPNCALAMADGTLSLQRAGKILDVGNIKDITAGVSGLAKLGAGVFLDINGRKWLVDFGLIYSRTSHQGAAKFLQLFNPLSGYTSVKRGKAYRDAFLEAFQQLGGRIVV